MEALIPTSPAAWWGIAAALLLAAELLLPGVYLFWLGLAAATVALVTLVTGFTLSLQLLLFALAALAWGFVGWRVYGRRTTGDQGALREPESQMVGAAGTVAQALSHGHGKVRIGDTLYLAEGPDLAEGTDIRVVGQKGTVVVVAAA